MQAESAQEAAAAGMTVEEYAAAGFEAPQQDSFSIYQLRNEAVSYTHLDVYKRQAMSLSR